MNIINTEISGVFVAETTPFVDHRGAFSRIYCDRDLAKVIGERRIVQINHSRTDTVGAVRGMHCQQGPYAEMKLIRCIKGKVWDVALDLRCGSRTFLKWHAEEISSSNCKIIVIPEGCAHGFQVLEPASELLYMHTAFYEPKAEFGVRYDDPAVDILWPLPPVDLSQRDLSHLFLTDDYQGIVL
ncbi:MAG: dTDP-4-dehydrorhamnose 3,5-epimerase family protein [Desulfobulbaceae bacterium]|nr:dTDP-4-dehydrorhamnose 3,5-epimerase family protein [Desulfobulbaceae bacterium]